MSASDIAKEILRVANTATLGKDVIDLLEKKLALLTEEISTLQAQLTECRNDNSRLKAQLQQHRPADSLPEPTENILYHFFDTGRDLTLEGLAQHFSMSLSEAQFHYDTLRDRGFARQTRAGFGNSMGAFGLTTQGRAYVMQHRNKS